MRDPLVQCQEELQIYQEIFPYVLADWNAIQSEKGIIAEGAAYLPELMKAQGFPADHYLSLTPTRDFQVSHYEKREWVPATRRRPLPTGWNGMPCLPKQYSNSAGNLGMFRSSMMEA